MDDLKWVTRRAHPQTGGRTTSVGSSASYNSIIPILTRGASLQRQVRRQLRSHESSKSDDGAFEIDATDSYALCFANYPTPIPFLTTAL